MYRVHKCYGFCQHVSKSLKIIESWLHNVSVESLPDSSVLKGCWQENYIINLCLQRELRSRFQICFLSFLKLFLPKVHSIYLFHSACFFFCYVVAVLVEVLVVFIWKRYVMIKKINKWKYKQDRLKLRASSQCQNMTKLTEKLRWKTRNCSSVCFFALSQSHHPSNLQKETVARQSLVMGVQEGLCSLTFSFGGTLFWLPHSLIFPFSWSLKQELEKVHHVSFACWDSHYEVLSTSQHHTHQLFRDPEIKQFASSISWRGKREL